MDEDGSGLLLVGDSGGVGVIIDAVNQAYLGSVSFCGFDLGYGSARGEKDDRFRACPGRGQGNALGVISGRAGDDALGLFFFRECGDLEVGASQLE